LEGGLAYGEEGTNGREARSSPPMEGSPVAKEDQDISREMGERLSLELYNYVDYSFFNTKKLVDDMIAQPRILLGSEFITIEYSYYYSYSLLLNRGREREPPDRTWLTSNIF
jgi:hypothetical protein